MIKPARSALRVSLSKLKNANLALTTRYTTLHWKNASAMKARIIIGMGKIVSSVNIPSTGIILIWNVNTAQTSKSTILILGNANTALNQTHISMASTVLFVQITNSITPSSINANLVPKERSITQLKWFVNVPRLILSRQLKVVFLVTGPTIFLSQIKHVYPVKRTIYLIKQTENVNHVHLTNLYSTRRSVFLALIIHSLTPF